MNTEMLSILESAISDVGAWTWWTAELPDVIQLEFSGTQLWNPPTAEGKPPSGQIALRFRKPRLAYFLKFEPGLDDEWPEKLQRDELRPFGVAQDAFTMTSSQKFGEIVGRATSIRASVGRVREGAVLSDGEMFLAFYAGAAGFAVVGESMVVVNHRGELDGASVVEASRKWWEYWREYWRRKNTAEPMPEDYACEVTIPAGSD
jgi:hypothetical protein